MNRFWFINKINVYLFFTGFVGHLLLVLVFIYLMYAGQLSARLLVSKVIDKLGLDVPVVINVALQPEVKNATIPMDGAIVKQHPRILLPQLVDWKDNEGSQFLKQRITAYKNNKGYLKQCGSNNFMSLTVCWLTTANDKVLKKLVSKMLAYKLNVPSADTNYSNGWQLALAYDLVSPALNNTQRSIVENRIEQALTATLLNLDEDAASLWHGRSTHAAIAWICAIVLSDRIEGIETLQRRAQAHFLTVIDALAYTAVWPGGYNYWIQSRGFLFALASSAYLNGLMDAKNAEQVKHVMRQVGYWTLYATRPDDNIEGFGDEGSRVDLKDETRRVIDLIVQMTKDPVLAGYSKYLAKLHKSASYYSGYRWGFLLFNDPTVRGIGNGKFSQLGRFLPDARLFGKGATNYAYFRSGWKKGDTFISFKAGHDFSHHGHYDAGHFTVFKGSPLAINSSTYHGFFNPHRLNYAIRTVAKNSLLIQKPNEKVKPNRHFKQNVADGGQRITMPTGSAVLSVADWFEEYQQGKHYEAAELLNFSEQENHYAYISADLTPAYNNSSYDENNSGGKISKAVRQLLYLPKEDHLIVYDEVISTKAKYQKKWLLHTVNKPKAEGLTVLKGQLNNGILETDSNQAVVENGRSFMTVKTIYPEAAVMRLIGGKDYQYYVETDADDSVLDGQNFKQGASTGKWHDIGMWRIEVQPKLKAKKDRFLVVLSPSIGLPKPDRVEKVEINDDDVSAVTTEKSVIVFAPSFGSKKIDFFIKESKEKLMVVGLSIFKKVTIKQNGVLVASASVDRGVAYYDAVLPLQGNISIEW